MKWLVGVVIGVGGSIFGYWLYTLTVIPDWIGAIAFLASWGLAYWVFRLIK